VATVVARLFHAGLPDRAYFGRKDAQQLAVIRAMVRDLGFPIEVVGCATTREVDGLAMSSRNARLSPQARQSAVALVRALADEGYQYRLNHGKPPIPRDKMVTFTQLPKDFAWKFMGEIEKGGIPVIPLRGSGQFNPDGSRDYDLLVPASAEELTIERHAAERERYLDEAATWREAYAAEHGWADPQPPRPGSSRSKTGGSSRSKTAGPSRPDPPETPGAHSAQPSSR
jgi:hypothetical protein